jgi:hypothetical protein
MEVFDAALVEKQARALLEAIAPASNASPPISMPPLNKLPTCTGSSPVSKALCPRNNLRKGSAIEQTCFHLR